MQNSAIYQRDLSTFIEHIREYKVAIVTTNFNHDITHTLSKNIIIDLCKLGMQQNNIACVLVAGALEIPFALQKLSLDNKYDALIAVGAVIRGDTYHFEIVCNQSALGIQEVSLKFNIPIINGILTINNLQQATDRLYKSSEFAYTTIDMILLSKGIYNGL